MRRKAHNFVTKCLYGKDYVWVHEVKDLPVRSLGFKHRAAMHDHDTAVLLVLIGKDLGVYDVSVLHDACDWASTEKRKRKL